MDVWVTNPYYQYFSGETRFQHQAPTDPTTLIKWRKRLGEEGMEWLLTTVMQSAVSTGVVERNSLAHLCVDSTEMEKNIAHPTDGRLLEELRVKLVDLVQGHELKLRESYSKQGPRLAQQVGRYAHAKQFKRMVVRLQRELQRQIDILYREVRENARELIALAKRVIAQAKNPKQRDKLYSLHEQEVDCILKGKAHKRYEFGSKVGIVTTQKRASLLR